ncbi:Protein-lysine N-methyltransferase efm4 [Coemansia sp. RSA 989]|nr:Protein-lysine N-methyltransferase efm4 [Coemansia sp. RSA 989]KAJ2674679.1 Protein-lysine N-methyltransferase efm4 [Coemansia sp. RSA 1085]
MTVSTSNESLRQQYAADKSHHLPNGRFQNPWPSFTLPPAMKFLKYTLFELGNNPARESLKEGRVPAVVPLDEQAITDPASLQVTWLGHASLLWQLDGANILCDPVFSLRCSPSQWIGPKRFTKAPCSVKELPHIDILILSHNHYDHLDWDTLKLIQQRFPSIKVFAPLGNRPILLSLGFSNIEIADWWDEFSVELPAGEFKLACTPAQHMTARGIFDRMATLWSSWVVIGPSGQKFFFSGDTAYSAVYENPAKAECPAFKQIGEVYGPIDLSAIAIGAYGPETMFGGMHANPEQAVRIHEDIGSKKSIGIHWGTFILTSEAIDEPPKRLALELKARGHAPQEFTVLDIGQTTGST